MTGGLLLLALVGVLDTLTGPELSFSLFYLAPIGLVSWFGRRRGGVLLAGAAAVTWLASDLQFGVRFSPPLIHEWNALIRLGIFVAFAHLLGGLKVEMRRTRELSLQDPLTGVANARGFRGAAEAEIARSRRTGQPLSVGYIDMDDFKAVNDRLGHLAGDDLLREVAQAIRSAVRSTDTVARVGGDEFLVLLPGAGQGDAMATLRRVRAVLPEPRGLPGPAGFSVGLVTFERAPASVDELLSRADALMYRAKQVAADWVRDEVVR